MRSTAADWPMIRLMVFLAAGAAVVLLLVAWHSGKQPLLRSPLPIAGAMPDRARDADAKKSAAEGYRIINEGTNSSARTSGEHVALRFKETEAKQGLGSADDQRPRPSLGGSNRGKSLKQS